MSKLNWLASSQEASQSDHGSGRDSVTCTSNMKQDDGGGTAFCNRAAKIEGESVKSPSKSSQSSNKSNIVGNWLYLLKLYHPTTCYSPFLFDVCKVTILVIAKVLESVAYLLF